MRSILVVSLLVVAFPFAATAQTEWLGPNLDRAYWLRVLKPNLDGDETIWTSAWAFGVHHRFETLALVAELPVVHWSVDRDYFPDHSDTALGNPYFGVAWGSESFEGSVGMRLPLASSGSGRTATDVGVLSDLVDRQEAFTPELLPVTAGMRASTRFGADDAWTFAVDTKVSGWLPFYEFGEPEAFLRLGAEAWYEGPRVVAGGGIVSRALMTGGFHSVEQLGGSIDVRLDGGWRPGVEIRVPLDRGLREEVVPYSIGAHLVWER